MPEARCKKQDAGSKMQDAGSKMQDAGCRILSFIICFPVFPEHVKHFP
jgi:hypothetical protein